MYFNTIISKKAAFDVETVAIAKEPIIIKGMGLQKMYCVQPYIATII